MKTYGVKRRDRGCCPGHDKYPSYEGGRLRGASFHSRTRSRKRRARQEARKDVRVRLDDS